MPDWINPVIDEKSVANVLPLAILPVVAMLRIERSQIHVFQPKMPNREGISMPENREIQLCSFVRASDPIKDQGAQIGTVSCSTSDVKW